MISSSQPTPDCNIVMVTAAPALLCVFNVNLAAAIGTLLEPSVMNWFELPLAMVKPVTVEELGDG
jgi:hypothetical protein